MERVNLVRVVAKVRAKVEPKAQHKTLLFTNHQIRKKAKRAQERTARALIERVVLLKVLSLKALKKVLGDLQEHLLVIPNKKVQIQNLSQKLEINLNQRISQSQNSLQLLKVLKQRGHALNPKENQEANLCLKLRMRERVLRKFQTQNLSPSQNLNHDHSQKEGRNRSQTLPKNHQRRAKKGRKELMMMIL